MIKFNMDTQRLCDKCSLPIDGAYVRWVVGEHVLHLHAPCGLLVSKHLKGNVHKLFHMTDQEGRTGE